MDHNLTFALVNWIQNINVWYQQAKLFPKVKIIYSKTNSPTVMFTMTQQQTATLYIFSGLPGAGKSTLAKHLAKAQQAQWLRIDTIEQSLKDKGLQDFYDAGYQVAFAIARDNLNLGLSVVADSSNPIEEARTAWRNVAHSVSCPYQEIEVICSDKEEHQHRVETRKSEVANLKLPTWTDVTARHYQPWLTPVIQIDTAGKTISQAFSELIEKLSKS